MKIKMCDENASKIAAALHRTVNGYSRHAFTTFAEVEALARRAERRLEKALGTAAKAKQGAVLYAVSSEPVVNSYRYSRRGNLVHMMRGGNDWFLVGAEPRRLYPEHGGRFDLLLTREQWDRAARRLAQQIGFSVQPKPENQA